MRAVLSSFGCWIGLECYLCSFYGPPLIIHWCDDITQRGLALEALITILTASFIPFFMILWVIGECLVFHNWAVSLMCPLVNVSVSLYPIEVLPSIFRYGYAAPFYNISHAIRNIVFGTKNTRAPALHHFVFIYNYKSVGLNFGVLIAWSALSCMTLGVIQWYVRRRDEIAEAGRSMK